MYDFYLRHYIIKNQVISNLIILVNNSFWNLIIINIYDIYIMLPAAGAIIVAKRFPLFARRQQQSMESNG